MHIQQPGAAAHDNAIGKRDDRLRKFINGEMRAVFGTEMDRHPVKVAARGDGVEIADIAAGAECARLRAGKNDMRHAIVGCPGRQRLPQRHGHIIAEGVQCLRPVHFDKPHLSVN